MVNKRAAGDSNKAVAFDFRRTFPLSGREPNRKTIMRNQKKFNKEGSVMNLNKGRSGRKASVLTEENLEKMKAMIEAEVDLPARMARSSCRKHNLDVPMSKRILVSFHHSSFFFRMLFFSHRWVVLFTRILLIFLIFCCHTLHIR